MLRPDWPAPACITAAVSTRCGGVSEGPYRSLNTATHVGDDPDRVARNRDRLVERLGLPAQPVWLNQVHGTVVVDAGQCGAGVAADAAFATRAGVVCAVQTADCLPVLFCNRRGTRVAVAHAGWRGLLAGVLENTVGCFDTDDAVLAWLGPAISREHFEVGPEVRDGFIDAARSDRRGATASAFTGGNRPGHWMADLYQLARLRLEPLGVGVTGGGLCTFADAERFFSYRRDGVCGRMTALICINNAVGER